LAEEQLALLDLRGGDRDAALDRLRALERSAAATPGLQQRASQLIVAFEAGSQLIDTAPEPAVVPVTEPAADPAPAQDTPAPAPEPEQGATPDADVGTDAEAANPAPADNN
jgi:hypothetical protein